MAREAAGPGVQTVHGLHLRGVKPAGSDTGSVSEDVDFDSRQFRTDETTGPLKVSRGFDGKFWSSRAGTVGVIDLPGMLADGRSRAFILSQGWLRDSPDVSYSASEQIVEDGRRFDVVHAQLKGSSPVDIWFDAGTHFLARTVLHGDYGETRVDYADIRDVAGLRWPFRSVETDPTGSTTTTEWKVAVPVKRGSKARFSPPLFRSQGSLRRSTTVTFRSDSPSEMSQIVLPVWAAGHRLQVVFDSGGSNLLSLASADRLGISRFGGLNVGGTGESSVEASVADIGALAVGGALVNGQQFIVLPLPYEMSHPLQGLDVDGVVGFELLASFRITVDYAGQTLTLEPFEAPAPKGVTLPLLSDGEHPFVWAEIDGVPGIFGIDTGDSGGVTVFETFAKSHHLFERGGVNSVGTGLGGDDAEIIVRGREFALAGTVFHGPVVSVPKVNSGDFAARSLAGNIGAQILSRFTITIDYRARMAIFRPNKSAGAPFLADQFGIKFRQNDPGYLEVAGVVAHSPAADAGLEIGDRLTSMNHQPAASLRLMNAISMTKSNTALSLTFVRGSDGQRSATLQPRELLGPPQ